MIKKITPLFLSIYCCKSEKFYTDKDNGEHLQETLEEKLPGNYCAISAIILHTDNNSMIVAS